MKILFCKGFFLFALLIVGIWKLITISWSFIDSWCEILCYKVYNIGRKDKYTPFVEVD